MADAGVTLVRGIAANAFTFTSNAADGDTVVIGNITYSFETGELDAAYKVDVGADLTASIANLVAAINLTGTAATDGTYGVGTLINPYVTASGADATTFDITAKFAGAHINGLYLAATSPGANTIAVTGGGATFAAVTSATVGSGDVATWVAGMNSYAQMNSEVIKEVNSILIGG